MLVRSSCCGLGGSGRVQLQHVCDDVTFLCLGDGVRVCVCESNIFCLFLASSPLFSRAETYCSTGVPRPLLLSVREREEVGRGEWEMCVSVWGRRKKECVGHNCCHKGGKEGRCLSVLGKRTRRKEEEEEDAQKKR